MSPIEQAQISELVSIGVDSCAGVSVLPRKCCADYPLEASAPGRQGAKYQVANGQHVKDEGTRTLYGYPAGSDKCGGFRFQVADVARPLMCVNDMLRHGSRVVFDMEDGQDISHIVHKKTGAVFHLTARNHVYDLKVDMMKYKEAVRRDRAIKAERAAHPNARQARP